MKTRFLFFILFVGFAFFQNVTAKAQYNDNVPVFKLGVETGFGITTKRSPFGYSTALHLLANFSLSPELSIIGAVGYSGLFTKDTSPLADLHLLPVKASIRMFPFHEQLYISPTVGAGFGLVHHSKVSFIFGGAIGYEWVKGYDLSLKFEGYKQSAASSTYLPINGQFSLSFGYYF